MWRNGTNIVLTAALAWARRPTMETDKGKTIINIYDKDGNPMGTIPVVQVNLDYRDEVDEESGDLKTLPIREMHFNMKLTLWNRIKVWWWFRKVKKGWLNEKK